jgi:glycosyltransferase involved in cell wall biosynthesis
LQAADAFFFPSTWEGQSLALLQARACGLPILASSIEGNTALLGVDHPGLFALDGEDACAALWQRAAGDSVWRENLVARQEALDLPCWDDLVENLHGLYRELAETAGAP